MSPQEAEPTPRAESTTPDVIPTEQPEQLAFQRPVEEPDWKVDQAGTEAGRRGKPGARAELYLGVARKADRMGQDVADVI